MQFEHGLLFDHHPGDPCIGHGKYEEEPDDCVAAEVQELDAQGKGHEDAGGEDVDGPFETHCCSLILITFDGFEVLQICSGFRDEILSG